MFLGSINEDGHWYVRAPAATGCTKKSPFHSGPNASGSTRFRLTSSKPRSRWKAHLFSLDVPGSGSSCFALVPNLHRESHEFLALRFLLERVERRENDLGVAGIGPMHRLAVMAQRFLGEAF